MKNKYKNIVKFFSGKPPEPEISADDAWGKMNDMLGAESTGGKVDQVTNAVTGSTMKMIAGLVLVGLTVVGVVLFLGYNVKNNFVKKENVTKAPLITSEGIEKSETTTNQSVNSTESDSIQTKKDDGPVSQETLKENKAPEIGLAFENKETFKNRDSSNHKGTLKSKETSASKDVSESIGQSTKAVADLKNVSHRKDRVKKTVSKRNLIVVNRKDIRRSKVASSKSGNTFAYIQESPEIKKTNATDSPTDEIIRNETNVLLSLNSLPVKLWTFDPNFSKKIQVKQESNANITKTVTDKPKENALAVGLEWNLNAPLKQTDFLFNSIDSIRKPATLLIPGIWVAKSFRRKHFLTLSLATNQPYFGNNNRIAQVTDTIQNRDSTYWFRNTNLIKTIGVNVALQYQYEFLNHFKIGAGVVYSRTLGALVLRQTFGKTDVLKASEYDTWRGSSQTNPYLNANVFHFKAGLSYQVARFQAGINILVPVNNVSTSSQYPIRAVNGQLFLRFRVW